MAGARMHGELAEAVFTNAHVVKSGGTSGVRRGMASPVLSIVFQGDLLRGGKFPAGTRGQARSWRRAEGLGRRAYIKGLASITSARNY